MAWPKIDPTDLNLFLGGYEIPFSKDEGTVQYYIGMLNRKFKTNIKEHIAHII